MKRREQAGFSLVELLIGLMLTALILQAIPPLLSTSFLSWRQSVARTATHQSARMAMEAMTRELRLASEVVSPLPGQAAASVSVDAPDETGRTTRLTFRLGTNHGANRRTLYRISGGGQPTPLTEDTVSEQARLVRTPVTQRAVDHPSNRASAPWRPRPQSAPAMTFFP